MFSYKNNLKKIHGDIYKQMLKKETQSSLFSPFKARLGKNMLSKLTREELEMLQTGELNAETLAKYK